MRKIPKKIKSCPLVTVITPTYNRVYFLEDTIRSVLSQDYPNIEYIVLNDGSTDETAKIVERFKDKIVWKSHKNMGEVRTVNKGFFLAHGEIIGVVNSDDPLLPEAISEIVKFMTQNPKIIVVYPDWIKIDKNGKEIEKVITPEYDYEYMLRTHDNVTGPGTFFSRVVIEKLKGRDLQFRYVSDYDFWLRAGLIGNFARIPKVLSTSRVHSGQATLKDKGYKMAMEHIHVLNKIFSLPSFPAALNKIKPEAYKKACEAARICRGNNLMTKAIISLVSLYYSPIPYLKTFFSFRLEKLHRLLVK